MSKTKKEKNWFDDASLILGSGLDSLKREAEALVSWMGADIAVSMTAIRKEMETASPGLWDEVMNLVTEAQRLSVMHQKRPSSTGLLKHD